MGSIEEDEIEGVELLGTPRAIIHRSQSYTVKYFNGAHCMLYVYDPPWPLWFMMYNVMHVLDTYETLTVSHTDTYTGIVHSGSHV